MFAPKKPALTLLATLGLFSACGTHPSANSELDGHFEESHAQQLNAFKGKQVVPPEYAPTDGLIVGDNILLEYEKDALIVAAFKAGIKKVHMLTTSSGRLTLESDAFDGLRRKIPQHMDNIIITPRVSSGERSVWARDYAPFMAVTKGDNPQLVMLDFNYFPQRPGDDSAARSLEGVMAQKRASIPVYIEGGNFMINARGDCMMTDRVLLANAVEQIPDDMILDEEAVKRYFIDYAGCQSVTVFPRMPVERTGHIDIWAKFINDDTVLVGEILAETLATVAGFPIERYGREIQIFLDNRARDITAMGYKVERVPMPAPAGSVRSYLNALLANGTAIVPRFGKEDDSYPDQELTKKYETAVKEIYKRHGFNVTWVDADLLTSNNGAIHCVTMQIPALQAGRSHSYCTVTIRYSYACLAFTKDYFEAPR